MEGIFGSDSKIVEKLDETTWKVVKNIDMHFTYSVPMDVLVHDKDIYRIMETVTGLNRDTMFDCDDLKRTKFKNSEE